MLSRRDWLIPVAALCGLATGLVRRSAAAEAADKVGKSVAKYQDSPKGGQICGGCKFYIPSGGHGGAGTMGGNMGAGMMGGKMNPGMMAAGDCQLVEGSISPRGWCVLYQPVSR